MTGRPLSKGMDRYDMSDTKSDAFFDKTVFGGYDPEQVDEFVGEARKLLAGLKKENEVLKQKLKILADKIEEYRAEELAAAPAEEPVVQKRPAEEAAADTVVSKESPDVSPDVSATAAAVQEAETALLEKRRQIELLESRLAELNRLTAEQQAKLETLRKKNADFAASLAAQYEARLQELHAAPEQTETAQEPLPLDDPADEASKIFRVIRTEEPEPVGRETEAKATAAPAAPKEAAAAEKTPAPAAETAEQIAETVASVEPKRPAAEQIGAGDSMYLNAEEADVSNLSYEEALALVLKKNGILQDTEAKPVAAAQPKRAADAQATKIIPRMPAAPAANRAHENAKKEKGKKAKKDGSFFKSLKSSIHNFLEDDDSSDDELDLFAFSEKQKKEPGDELQFGKAYNVKKDR